mgnify:CR=1 FL=1
MSCHFFSFLLIYGGLGIVGVLVLNRVIGVGALYINMEEFAFNTTSRYYNTTKTQQEVNYCIYFLISVLELRL